MHVKFENLFFFLSHNTSQCGVWATCLMNWKLEVLRKCGSSQGQEFISGLHNGGTWALYAESPLIFYYGPCHHLVAFSLTLWSVSLTHLQPGMSRFVFPSMRTQNIWKPQSWTLVTWNVAVVMAPALNDSLFSFCRCVALLRKPMTAWRCRWIVANEIYPSSHDH